MTDIALFDLDGTLLNGDSDFLWGEFLCDNGFVDAEEYRNKNAYFFKQYKNGTLDHEEYLAFCLAPLAKHDNAMLYALRKRFVDEIIRPSIKAQTPALLATHREAGRICVLITATNTFIAEPIATMLGFTHFLATIAEQDKNGNYTGGYTSPACFRDGKIIKFNNWCVENNITPKTLWGYSDSANDLPLLAFVHHPYVVDGDHALRHIASLRGWPAISLR